MRLRRFYLGNNIEKPACKRLREETNGRERGTSQDKGPATDELTYLRKRRQARDKQCLTSVRKKRKTIKHLFMLRICK